MRGWLAELIETEDAGRAERLYSEIEDVVVPVNGPMVPGADAVAACAVQALMTARSNGQVEILQLLFQLAAGSVSEPGGDLAAAVRREVELGLPIFAEIAEGGSPNSRRQCIDLLSLVARFNPESRRRATFLLSRIATFGEAESESVAVELRDLSDDGFDVA